jgi:uncharacterized membrane protein (DUF373 family)
MVNLVTVLPAYKKIVMYTAIAVIGFVIFLILLSTIMDVLGSTLNKDLLTSTRMTVLNLIGNFLLLVVCVELMDTLYAYAVKQQIHVEIVILVALTAVARELIVFNYETVSAVVLMGVGAAILSLSISYFLIRRCRMKPEGEAV